MSEANLHEQAESVATLMQRLMRRLFTINTDDVALHLPGQMRVCAVLREGPRTMSALSRDLGVSLSAVTQIADRLEEAGMVERVPESDDRRCKCLQLTEKGGTMMSARRQRLVEQVRVAMNAVPPDKRDQVVQALQLLLDAGISVSSGEPDA